MVHKSGYRGNKPEWEGANTRIASGLSVGEVLFCLQVIVLMSINSKSAKNMAYTPVFFLKFLRGFVEPQRWRRLARVQH